MKGLFSSDVASAMPLQIEGGLDVKLLHQLQCQVCPLNKLKGNKHPQMPPSGSLEPIIYVLGEAPGCISGDALIDTAFRDKSKNPKGVEIQTLVGRKDFLVYAYDLKKEDITLATVRRVWKTGRKMTYRVTYQWWYRTFDGSTVTLENSLVVSSNHPFLLRNPKIKQDPFRGATFAKRYLSIDEGLAVGHSLQPFNRRGGTAEDRPWIASAGKLGRREAIFLTEWKLGRAIRRNENCHHRDENPLNDAWGNLECLTTAEHWRHHSTKNNVMRRIDVRAAHKQAMARPEYRSQLSLKLKAYLANPNNYKKWLRSILKTNSARSETVKKHFRNPEFYWQYLVGRKNYCHWNDQEVLRRFQEKFPGSDNHIITKIESVGVQDVYDMEVEKYHNFAVNGIFVHNSEEDLQGEQFVGDSGSLLRRHIPREFRGHLRFNNVCRTRPPNNRTPTQVEIEACRPSIQKDIEETQPLAIFGFGNVPLDWVCGATGITMWRGRRLPVRVGRHVCWYYPMFHPAYILHLPERGFGSTGYRNEEERILALDLKRACVEIKHLPEPVVHTEIDARKDVEIVATCDAEGLDRIGKFLTWALQQPVIGVDYETSGLRPYRANAKVLTAAVSDGERTLAFPFDHPDAGWSKSHRAALQNMWILFLQNARGVKVSHGLSFELEWTGVMFNRGLIRAGRWEDTATQASVIDERTIKRKEGPLSLDSLVLQYFGFNLKAISALDKENMEQEPLGAILIYNGMDAKYHKLLWQEQARVIKTEGLDEPYQLSLRRVPTVVLSQIKGVPVDQKVLKEFADKYGGRLEDTKKKLFARQEVQQFRQQLGKPFNPGSPHDVLLLLKDVMHRTDILVDDYKGGRRYSTDESVLSKMKHPVADLILEYRSSAKCKSTYIEPLQKLDPEGVLYSDGLLHTSYNTFFASTGRISSDKPNLQNFPKRDDEQKEIRRVVAAMAGDVCLSFDYGQIEARVIAMFTKDKRFCKALWDRYDIHGDWAERIAFDYPSRIGGRKNLTDKKIMKDFRTDIKNQWTFPLVFGAQLSSISEYLKIPENYIEPQIRTFWQEFSGIKDWQEKLLDFYRHNGYVECLTKRRRHGPLSINKVYNSGVQGTAADIVMDGMCRISELNDWELQPEFNIHDDLTFVRVKEDGVDDIAEKVITEMLSVPFDFVNVPITVEMSMGPNWGELKEVQTFSSDTWEPTIRRMEARGGKNFRGK